MNANDKLVAPANTLTSTSQLDACVARGRQLRSLAVIELTRQLYNLPAKCVQAYSNRLDRRASNLGGSCMQCA